MAGFVWPKNCMYAHVWHDTGDYGLRWNQQGYGLFHSQPMITAGRFFCVCLIGQPLALDEVPPRLTPALVVLHHGQFLGHVEGDVIGDGSAISSASGTQAHVKTGLSGEYIFDAGLIRQIWRQGQTLNTNKVLILNEAILGDTLLDPVGEIPANLKKFMQIAGVA
jgi:hypothetical protein